MHLRNLARKLGEKAEAPADRIAQRDLESFLQARLKERSPSTVDKERTTIIQLFRWAVGQGDLESSPAVDLPVIKRGGAEDHDPDAPSDQGVFHRELAGGFPMSKAGMSPTPDIVPRVAGPGRRIGLGRGVRSSGRGKGSQGSSLDSGGAGRPLG